MEKTGKEAAGKEGTLDVLEISNQFYLVRYDGSPRGFSVLDGPFAERHWAVSVGRVNDV